MALTCNINAKGRALRLVMGVFNCLLGLALLAFWAWGSGEWVRWLISLAALAAGAFQIFEARAGWCIVRAMGFRTPI